MLFEYGTGQEKLWLNCGPNYYQASVIHCSICCCCGWVFFPCLIVHFSRWLYLCNECGAEYQRDAGAREEGSGCWPRRHRGRYHQHWEQVHNRMQQPIVQYCTSIPNIFCCTEKYSLFLGIKKKMECKMKELKHVVIIGVFIYLIYSLPLVPCPSYSVSIIFYRSSNHHPMLHSSCKSSTCLQTVLCKNCMIDNQLTHW